MVFDSNYADYVQDALGEYTKEWRSDWVGGIMSDEVLLSFSFLSSIFILM